jgi:hypothetical protein
MASRRSKSKCAHTATDRPEDGVAHVPNLATWSRQLVSKVADELCDDDRAQLDAQIRSLAQAEPLAGSVQPDPTMPRVVRDLKGLRAAAKMLATAVEVAIDIETSSLDPSDGEIVGVGLSVADANFYFPTGHRLEEGELLRPDQLPVHVVAGDLRLGQLPLVAHNAKFEFRWLRRRAGVACTFVWDIMLAARLLASHLPADLKDLARRELDAPDWALSKHEIVRVQFLPVERVARYCAKDCRYTLELYWRQTRCPV